MIIFQRIYEGTMILLVVLTIMAIWTEHPYNQFVHWIVWGIFLVDFLIRYIKAEQKWTFIKKNPFLVIAIIPFDQFFQIARIVRVIYLFRIKTVTKFYIQPIIDKASYQSKVGILGLLLLLLTIKSAVLWKVEAKVVTFLEAFIFVIKHMMFFGHRGIEVSQFSSIILLVFTTILGVLLHGLALQWLFTKLDEVYTQYKNEKSIDNEKSI
ncbi:MAG: transporter [Bacillaceae bacterium]|nr:transporter [Bacillaceae bacterium]